jgi:hypothetical protein
MTNVNQALVPLAKFVKSLGDLNIATQSRADFPLITKQFGVNSGQMVVLKYPTSYKACVSQIDGLAQDLLRFVHTKVEYINLQQDAHKEALRSISKTLSDDTSDKTLIQEYMSVIGEIKENDIETAKEIEELPIKLIAALTELETLASQAQKWNVKAIIKTR